MNIAYRVAPDDVVAFNVHVTESASGFRGLVMAVAGVVGVALYWMVAAGTDSGAAASATALLGAVGYLAGAPRLLRFSVGRIVRRRLARTGSRLVGDHEMVITNGTLVGRSPGAESATLLGAIRGVIRRGDRAFIYLTADSAYILPRRGVVRGDFDAFLEALTIAVSSARN